MILSKSNKWKNNKKALLHCDKISTKCFIIYLLIITKSVFMQTEKERKWYFIIVVVVKKYPLW